MQSKLKDINTYTKEITIDVPWEDLEENFKGLILLSGSFDGLVGKLFFKNLLDEIFFF